MSILIDQTTRVLVQGITGSQGRFDTQYCVAYGTNIVAGVTPGRGGQDVEGIPVFNTVRHAVGETGASASVIYVPAAGIKDAVLEAVDAGIKVIVALTENVPRHDAATAVAATRAAGAWLIGFNTNGMVSPGKSKLGGIGGDRADELYVPGRIGVCSRSGGMSAELSAALAAGGYGVSTCISMGGDPITGNDMVEYAREFEADPDTDGMLFYGEPGSENEQGLAKALQEGEITKPVVAMISGVFQESHPAGLSFGHVAAMIRSSDDSASAKQKLLSESGAHVAHRLGEIPELLNAALG
ncbi:MAG: succinate--CoA ligase subunit alpha [Alphaproteobacteria bacterium]|nr:succinate--CoA ligase subunit alpha [Alphaproteobacteria bacterium]